MFATEKRGRAMLGNSYEKRSGGKVPQSNGKAKIARQGRSKARIGNGVVTHALLRQARAEMGTDRHGKGNVKLSNA